MITLSGFHCTVKLVLTTTSEQPVYNNQPDPQWTNFEINFIGNTYTWITTAFEQQYLFVTPKHIFKFFWGGTWGCEKIWEGVLYFRVLLHFNVTIFQSLLRGYMRCPPLSPPPPLCASMVLKVAVEYMSDCNWILILIKNWFFFDFRSGLLALWSTPTLTRPSSSCTGRISLASATQK